LARNRPELEEVNVAHRAFDLDTFLSVPYVDPDYGFSLSPDGAQVAFSANLSGEWQIYRTPLDGSTPPRQITRGPGTKVGPRWSPDGTRLGYALDLDGGERFDIFAYDLATGQHHNLTPDTPDSIQPNFSWSPDGSRIAFISDRSGSFDTYAMPALGGPIRRVFRSPRPHWEVRWSPDGHWLAVVVEASGQDYATYIVPAAGGPATPIGQDGEWIPAGYARWSPNAKRLAFSSYRSRYHEIGLYDVATGEITWLSEAKADQEQPTWSPDGRCLAYVLTDGPVTRLAVADLRTGSQTTHQVGEGIHHRPRFSPDGTRLAFVFDSPRRPDELWSLSLRYGSFRQVTSLLPLELRDAPFITPTQVRYPSLDGHSVPALLYCPSHVKGPAPAVLFIHGGPNWLSQIAWHPLLQHMVSRGWVVLAPNYRGSTGYGRDWQLANRFDLGGGDTQDIVAGADYLVQEQLADPRRIAPTGRSYGGYLTMMCLTHYPDRWAAGSAVVPFLNWFTGHANSREDLQHWDLENFGDPEKDRDRYHERSPFFFLNRIQAPVQLICGAHDPRCPASESTQAHAALLAQGKPCDLALYPDEGHAFRKLKNVIDAQKRLVNFLARALETEEPAVTLE
jgi:dipeptidyl aminopeptidase/acylaminoacyl peptidase